MDSNCITLLCLYFLFSHHSLRSSDIRSQKLGTFDIENLKPFWVYTKSSSCARELDLSYPHCSWVQPFSATLGAIQSMGRPGSQADLWHAPPEPDSRVPILEASGITGMTKPFLFKRHPKIERASACAAIISGNICYLCVASAAPLEQCLWFQGKTNQTHVFVLNVLITGGNFRQLSFWIMKNGLLFFKQGSWERIKRFLKRHSRFSIPVLPFPASSSLDSPCPALDLRLIFTAIFRSRVVAFLALACRVRSGLVAELSHLSTESEQQNKDQGPSLWCLTSHTVLIDNQTRSVCSAGACLRRGPHLPSFFCHCPQSGRCGEINSAVFGSAPLFDTFRLGDLEGCLTCWILSSLSIKWAVVKPTCCPEGSMSVHSWLANSKGHVGEGWPTAPVFPGLKSSWMWDFQCSTQKELGKLGPWVIWSLCVFKHSTTPMW